MKFDSLRSALFGSAFALLASVLLAACGGGGAGSPAGPIGGSPQILPATATLYAGVEYTFTVGGGRPPYFLSSSEPSLLAVPQRVDGNFFTVIPNNPSVIDSGLAPGSLPVRTVTITMRDSVGSTASTTDIKIARNFLTGYGVSYRSNCSAPTSGAPPAACAGGETAVTLSASISGNLNGNRPYRFEVLRGPFYWVYSTGVIAGNTIIANTNHEGDVTVIFRVNPNVGTQLGIFRVTDVQTGVSTEHIFTINGIPLGGELEAIPDTFTFTGATTAQCGTGSADFLVFDGTPPYTALSSSPNVTVTPSTTSSQPGRFTLTASNPNVCVADATIVIFDGAGSRTTVTVTTAAGSAAPPPTPVSVTPGSLNLACGQSGSVSILGGPTGTATFSVSSADPKISATAAGRTVTVTRAAVDAPLPPLAPRVDANFTVTVTDGASSTSIGVTAPNACPHS